MTAIFADTSFWVAVINPADEWHQRAVELHDLLGTTPVMTTEAVLIEALNYFCAYRPRTKRAASMAVRHLLVSDEVEVLPQTRLVFSAGHDLYDARLDKGYSLTDCISMNVMRERGITEVLTHDHHFAQEGFITLF